MRIKLSVEFFSNSTLVESCVRYWQRYYVDPTQIALLNFWEKNQKVCLSNFCTYWVFIWNFLRLSTSAEAKGPIGLIKLFRIEIWRFSKQKLSAELELWSWNNRSEFNSAQARSFSISLNICLEISMEIFWLAFFESLNFS